MEGLIMQKKKNKGGLIRRTWERCKSFNLGHIQTPTPMAPQSPTCSPGRPMVKSKSWSSFAPSSPFSPRGDKGVMGRSKSKKLRRVDSYVPHGCFSVYVGPDRQRFVLKIEYTKHHLFKMLLDEAALEYGFHHDGPLVLPCEVDLFVKVLYEIECGPHDEDECSHLGCGFPRNRSSYQLLSPARLAALNQMV